MVKSTMPSSLDELARVARLRPAAGEDHADGRIRHAAIELAVDEIGAAAEEQADRRGAGDEIDQRQEGDLLGAAEEQEGEDGAEHAAMEGHAAFPQAQYMRGMLNIIVRFVEEHIADAAAEHDAEHRPYHHVVERRLGQAGDGALGMFLRQHPPAEQDAADIGQRIPAYGQRAELKGDRVDMRKGEHGPDV